MYIKLRPIPFRYTIVPADLLKRFSFSIELPLHFCQKSREHILWVSFRIFKMCLLQLPEEITETLYSLQWGPTKACDQRVMDQISMPSRPCWQPALQGTWREQAGGLILAQWLLLVRFPGLGQSLESSRKGWLHWVTWSSVRILWWEQEKGVISQGASSLGPVLPMRGIKLWSFIPVTTQIGLHVCPSRGTSETSSEISLRIIEIKPYLSHTQTHSLLYLTCSWLCGTPLQRKNSQNW